MIVSCGLCIHKTLITLFKNTLLSILINLYSQFIIASCKCTNPSTFAYYDTHFIIILHLCTIWNLLLTGMHFWKNNRAFLGSRPTKSAVIMRGIIMARRIVCVNYRVLAFTWEKVRNAINIMWKLARNMYGKYIFCILKRSCQYHYIKH